VAGIMLIFLGFAFFLKNYNIAVTNTLMLLGGFYFLYEYATKRQQAHLIFGVVLSSAGAVMLLRDLGRLRFDISGEMFFLGLGAVFLFLYFNRGITGFVFPGYILPVFAFYSIIENNLNDNYMWPSFFILLGLAFYLIYFTAFIHKSSWPLIPGTILIIFGLGAFAFVLGIVSIEMIIGLQQYKNYILSVGIVLLGVGLLYKSLKK
jgi:hypothetical protein